MIAILLLMAAQAAEPTPATAQTAVSIDGFQIGSDTLATVTAKLGKPFTMLHNSDGTAVAIYASTRTRVKGSTFIPIVGMFAGGAKGSYSTKTFVFDPKGLLKSYSSSDTTTDCHLALGGANCH
jgi:hypothetical protein